MFVSRVLDIDQSNQARVASTWRPGAPVDIGDLRLVELSHFRDDGEEATGELVINHLVVDDVIDVFAHLHRVGFPIHRMDVVDVFGGDDNASMRANNTSAFNCREIDGRPGQWSQHAYGLAIDVNPLVNPWVRGSQVDPPEGAPFVDRTLDVAGLVVAGGVVTAAFEEIGWQWGGDWHSQKDYQHFSANGG